jgi:predicted transposase/invertase (TIGR01784 family)
MIYADPTNDFAFKKIFGSKDHPQILIAFLNAILELPAPIEYVELANPYQIPKIEELKATVLDIRARDARGVEFIVEMQVEKDAAFAKRSLYYTAKSYVAQLKKGEDYPTLNQVFFIGILDFAMFDSPSHISRHLILNKDTGEHVLKDFEFTFVELPKFNKTLDELDNPADPWLYFIKHAKRLDSIPAPLQQPVLQEAFEAAAQTIWSPEEIELYDYRKMHDARQRSVVETARMEGEAKGRAEGRAEALQEALQRLLITGMDEAAARQLLGL